MGGYTYPYVHRPFEILLCYAELILENQYLSTIYILAGMNHCALSLWLLIFKSHMSLSKKVFLSSTTANREGKNLGSIRSTPDLRFGPWRWSRHYLCLCSYFVQCSWNPPSLNTCFSILLIFLQTIELQTLIFSLDLHNS